MHDGVIYDYIRGTGWVARGADPIVTLKGGKQVRLLIGTQPEYGQMYMAKSRYEIGKVDINRFFLERASEKYHPDDFRLKFGECYKEYYYCTVVRV